MKARLRFEVLAADGFRCFYCGRDATEVPLHVDHRHPRALGGTDERWNLVAACRGCNLGKGASQVPFSRARQGELWGVFVWNWIGVFGRAELGGLPDMRRTIRLLQGETSADLYGVLDEIYCDADGEPRVSGRDAVALFWRKLRARGLQ